MVSPLSFIPVIVAPLGFARNLVWEERTPLPLPRAGYMAGVIDNKYVIAGGSYWSEKQKHWTDQVDAFDPASNNWTRASFLPEPRSDAAVVSFENNLYIFGGGANGSIRKDALVFEKGNWSPLPKAELPEPRLYSVATVCCEKVYLLGGLSKPGNYTSISKAFWVWNPRAPNEGWKAIEPMPGPGLITFAMAGINGKIYVLGGAKAGEAAVVNVKTAYEYDCQSQRWARLPDLRIDRRCWWGIAMNDSIALIGGYSTTFERDVFAYSPISHTLTSLGQMPHGICDGKFLWIGDSIIGTGGETAPMVRGHWTLEARLSDGK